MNQNTIKNRINFKTLTTILGIQTESYNDEDMLSYILERLKEMDVTVQQDDFKNIYVTKGESKVYPCVVAHTDTVHKKLTNVNIFRTDDTLFAFDPKSRKQCGIGGDDKVGVYITLQLLEDMPIMKAVFFRDEEVGCRGSSYSIKNHKDWYSDCGYVLMADRRGNSDVITVSGGIVISSTEFLEACDSIFEKYGYKDAVGITTDVDALTYGGIGVSTVNFSCGYHDPHSSREVVSISDVNVCYNLMYDIITTHPDKTFKYEATIPSYKHTYSKRGTTYNDSFINSIAKSGASTDIRKRQEKLFTPLTYGYHKTEHSLFVENDITKDKVNIYSYRGVKALPITLECSCNKCKTSGIDNIFYLPFEGRMFCTKCNYYIDDNLTPYYLKFLEVDDNGVSFVYSLYANGWIKKSDAKWYGKLSSWVSIGLPFN